MSRGKGGAKPSIKTGDVFITNFGECTVVKYINCDEVTVIFSNTGYQGTFTAGSLRKGLVLDRLVPTVAGVGYRGDGCWNEDNQQKAISDWRHMLHRCYGNHYKGYDACTVCEEWCNFQNFADWHICNYKEGFALDKDLLVRGNTVYSPETCEYVPQELNNLFCTSKNRRGKYKIGVTMKHGKFYSHVGCNGERICLGDFATEESAFLAYKERKESIVVSQASKFYSLGSISHAMYTSLLKYEVREDD